MRLSLAPINLQAASFWFCRLDYDDNQKARKDSLKSYGRLAFCSITKIVLAFISRAARSTEVHHESRPLKKRCFRRSRYQGQNICTINVIFFTYINETAWKVFLFKMVGRVFDRDIIFWDRTYLVFCFLGCVVKPFQASEANSWRRSGSSNPGNRVCVLFLFLSFFFFSFLLFAFFLLHLYLVS